LRRIVLGPREVARLSPSSYFTVRDFVALALPQVTVTGQLPVGVLAATFQDQVTFPELLEVFDARPAALLRTPL
jgi:hypothetical protein